MWFLDGMNSWTVSSYIPSSLSCESTRHSFPLPWCIRKLRNHPHGTHEWMNPSAYVRLPHCLSPRNRVFQRKRNVSRHKTVDQRFSWWLIRAQDDGNSHGMVPFDPTRGGFRSTIETQEAPRKFNEFAIRRETFLLRSIHIRRLLFIGAQYSRIDV